MKSPIAVVAAIVSLAGVCAGEGARYRGVFVNDEDWSLRPWAVTCREGGNLCWHVALRAALRYTNRYFLPAGKAALASTKGDARTRA